MPVLRYLLYLGFVFAAITFWALCLGFSMGDPACLAEGLPCPEPSYWEHGAKVLLIFSAMPLSALTFVFYRRAVRRLMALD